MRRGPLRKNEDIGQGSFRTEFRLDVLAMSNVLIFLQSVDEVSGWLARKIRHF